MPTQTIPRPMQVPTPLSKRKQYQIDLAPNNCTWRQVLGTSSNYIRQALRQRLLALCLPLWYYFEEGQGFGARLDCHVWKKIQEVLLEIADLPAVLWNNISNFG